MKSIKTRRDWGIYADGMMELDDIVGELTQTLADLGVEENTIVVFLELTMVQNWFFGLMEV